MSRSPSQNAEPLELLQELQQRVRAHCQPPVPSVRLCVAHPRHAAPSFAQIDEVEQVLMRLERKHKPAKASHANHTQPPRSTLAAPKAPTPASEQPPTPRQRPSSAQEPSSAGRGRKGGADPRGTPRGPGEDRFSHGARTPDSRTPDSRTNGKREPFSPSHAAFGGARSQSSGGDRGGGSSRSSGGDRGGGGSMRGRGRGGQSPGGRGLDSPRDLGGGGKGGDRSQPQQSTPPPPAYQTYKRLTPQEAIKLRMEREAKEAANGTA
jgi:hypothetical protein